MHKKALSFALVFLFLVASCLKKPEVSVSDISSPDVSSTDAPSVVTADFSSEKYMFVKELNSKGKMVFFYQDQEGYTHYYNGREDRIINREVMDKYKKMGAVPMDMSYGYDGKHIYFSQPVRWGPKKLIFIKLEPDGQVVYTKELSFLQEVISPATIAFDGKGGMLLTWIDETSPYIKGAYMLVKGDSFPEKEETISYEDSAVLSAKPAFTDKGFAVVYVSTNKKGRGEIKARFLSDGSEKALYSGNISNFYMAEENGFFLITLLQISPDIQFIVFNNSFERIKEYTVHKPREIGEAFSLFSNMRLVQGEPLVFGGGSPPMSVKVEDYSLRQKVNLFYSYAGRDFERVVGGKPFMFTSKSPSFDSSEKYMVVAYLDRRFASATVMVAVFDSGGKLIKRDIVIEKPGVDTASPAVVHLGADVFRVFYPLVDNEKKVWLYRSKDIRADRIESLYSLPPEKERKELLMESVVKFLECRKKNDYGCVYDMLDPIYRAGTPKDKHVEMMKTTNATIIDYRYENCRILEDSVLAACDGYLTAKLPDAIQGMPIKENQKNLEKKIQGELWVFVDGKWYYLVELPMLGYAQQW